MANLIYPNVGALKVAGVVRTHLASSVLKLFKTALNLTPATTVAELDAAECDFDGYAAKTITAMLAAYLDPDGGASFQTGTQQFDFSTPSDPPVTNNVYGFWLENAAGDLIVAGSFDAGISMAQVGDSIPVSVIMNYGRS